MNRLQFLTGSLLLGIGASLLGAWHLVQHLPHAHLYLAVGILAALAFLGTALYEVLTSRRVTGGEKVLWTALLLTGGTVAGVFYMLLGRKSVAPVLGQ